MAWSSVGTTLAMTGFLGVVAAGFYVMKPNQDEHRIERMCKPIRTGSDLAYSYIGKLKPGVRDEVVLYPKGIEVAHTDICVNKVASWLFSEEAASVYRAKDEFKQMLLTELQLDKEEVEAIMKVGEDSKINWLNTSESAQLLSEYMDYMKHRRVKVD